MSILEQMNMNHALLLALLLALTGILIVIMVDFIRRPAPEKIGLVREWLLWAVARAESYLGGGKGKEKLEMVYHWFQFRFPVLCKIVSREEFESMVNDALYELEQMLMDEKIVEMMIKNAEGADE